VYKLLVTNFLAISGSEIKLYQKLSLMKKQLILCMLLMAAALGAFAQKTDTARMLIHYKFTWVRDTVNRAHPYTENMVLYFGKNAGAYRSYDGIVYKAQFKKAFAEAAAASPDGRPMINRHGVGSPVEYYQYPNEQKLVIMDQLMVNSYAISGPMPVIHWKTSGDTATFGGLHCQKATCHFKGRDYTVWFCPDLPVHTGPWKLNGLPGVIVDARDTKNEVIFQFDGAEKATPTAQGNEPAVAEKDLPPIVRDLNDDMNLIAPPSRAIKTTPKDFDKLKAAMQKDPQAFAEGIQAANRASGDAPMDHIKIKQGPGLRGPVINNPMELPEKK
jgi:GLPGLI family protein